MDETVLYALPWKSIQSVQYICSVTLVALALVAIHAVESNIFIC